MNIDLRPLLALPLSLAACQPAPESASNRNEGPVAATGLPTPSPTPAPGEAAAATPLSEADMTAAALPGELACSFTDGTDRPLLIARGDVGGGDRAAAIVKVAGKVVRLSSPGGFDAMVRGARFTGDNGLTVRIEPTGRAVGGGESPPLPATLVLERPGGAPFAASGDWTCGP